MRTVAVVMLGLLSGCSSRSLGARDGAADSRDAVADAIAGEVVFEIAPINRDVDILFMIDNSRSTFQLQNRLSASFSGFVNVLKGLPGGLPNLHIGVVSSDLGAGKFDIADIPGCRHGGDQGIMQSQPRGATCGAGSLLAGQHFISNIDGVANYTGDLADVFACIATLGDLGCGFEHQFGSVLRALGADGNGGPPPENYGFLRPNARLVVVFVTDEDDCSAPLNSSFFDPSSRLVSDPLGPLASYRCNAYGHLCGGAPPPRTMAADLTGTCTSAEDGRLLRVADVATALKQLKPQDPSLVAVAAIAGPPVPYKVALGPASVADDPALWPYVEHSCSSSDGAVADPGIRMKGLVEAFGGQGSFDSACSDSPQGYRQLILDSPWKASPSCIGGDFVDALPETLGVEPDCTAVDHVEDDVGTLFDLPVKSYRDAQPGDTQWGLSIPTPECSPGRGIEIRRADPPGPPGLHIRSTTLTCQVCTPGDPRPGCAYLR